MIATGRSLLRLAAKELLEELAAQTRGIPIRLVPRINLQVTETNGWSCNIASLGKGRPRLELWFDHYADHRSRRFWFGFYSPKKTEINRLIVRAPSFLRPYRRQIFSNDIEKTKEDDWRLRKPLSKSDFGLTFHEQYANTSHYFFGIFDRQAITSRRKLRLLTKRAAVFATDVVRNLPQMKPPDRDNIVYPRIENRKIVRKHVFRERDSSLSEACKIRDKYCCRVCSMTFEKTYGEFGKEFAEAHHIIPLSKLRGRVERSPDDLVTVCANCHRMLHKMDGTEGDVPRLRRIVRKRKKMN